MRPRKAPTRRETHRELRTAALARWEDESTISSIAERLERTELDVALALAPVVAEIKRDFDRGVTVAGLAAGLGIPESFVRYCIRSIYAGIRSR